MRVKVEPMTGIEKEADFDSGGFLHGKPNSLQSSLDESPSAGDERSHRVLPRKAICCFCHKVNVECCKVYT